MFNFVWSCHGFHYSSKMQTYMCVCWVSLSLITRNIQYTIEFVKLEVNHAHSFTVILTSDKRWACLNQSLKEVLIGRWAGLCHPWGEGLKPRRVITWRREWRVNDGRTFCSILYPQINTISWILRLKRGQEPEREKKSNKKVASTVENWTQDN